MIYRKRPQAKDRITQNAENRSQKNILHKRISAQQCCAESLIPTLSFEKVRISQKTSIFHIKRALFSAIGANPPEKLLYGINYRITKGST